MSWTVDVIADDSGKWSGNQLRFDTEEGAKRYARDLAARWTMVSNYRVLESTDPANVTAARGGGLMVIGPAAAA